MALSCNVIISPEPCGAQGKLGHRNELETQQEYACRFRHRDVVFDLRETWSGDATAVYEIGGRLETRHAQAIRLLLA